MFQLAAHRKIHGEANFVCEECNRCFKTRGHLLRHQIIHTNKKPFSCEHCLYSCNVKTNLKKHLKLIHQIFDLDSTNRNTPDEHDGETPESVRGNIYADKLMKAYSEKTDKALTIDILKRKQQENQEKRLVDLEQTKNSLIRKKRVKNSNRSHEHDTEPPLERSVLVHKSDDNSSVIALDEVTRSVISLSPRPMEGSKIMLPNLDNLAHGTIIQFDEVTGQVFQITDGSSILNDDLAEENTQVILADGTTLQLRMANVDQDDQLVIDSISALDCDVLDKASDTAVVAASDDQDGAGKEDAPQIVFIVNDEVL